jgi:hypothetical protein
MPNGLPTGKACQIRLPPNRDKGCFGTNDEGLDKLQKMQAEELIRVGPNLNRLPASPFG